MGNKYNREILDLIRSIQDIDYILPKDIPNIEVVSLLKKFPQGSEKHLIYAITKREVPSGALPSAVGCIVDKQLYKK